MLSLTVSLGSLAQPVPLGTGAPIASTRVTVTMEPSAAPTTGSADAALAGLDSTAPSVSLSAPPGRNRVPPTVCNAELQPKYPFKRTQDHFLSDLFNAYTSRSFLEHIYYEWSVC